MLWKRWKYVAAMEYNLCVVIFSNTIKVHHVHYVKTKINDPSPPNIFNDTLIGQLGEAKTSPSPVST